MRELTIVGAWWDRKDRSVSEVTRRMMARHEGRHYEDCPWVPESLRTRADSQAVAEIFMARTERVIRFMDATGLKPYGRGWERRLRRLAPGLERVADHPMLWRDEEGQWVVTMEFYDDLSGGAPRSLGAWAVEKRWRLAVPDRRTSMWNPDLGCELVLMTTQHGGADLLAICMALAKSVPNTAGKQRLH